MNSIINLGKNVRNLHSARKIAGETSKKIRERTSEETPGGISKKFPERSSERFSERALEISDGIPERNRAVILEEILEGIAGWNTKSRGNVKTLE